MMPPSIARAAASAANGHRSWGGPRLSKSDSGALRQATLLEVPTSLVEETQQIVVEAMESTPADFSMPLRVEARTGRTWAECQ